MTRLYYTCPIEAAYMIEHFDVNFEMLCDNDGNFDGVDTKELFDFDLLLACHNYPSKNKIYVEKRSEHKFDQRQGDIIHYCLLGTRETYTVTDTPCQWSKDVTNIKIIMRNDKPFFVPEVEND